MFDYANGIAIGLVVAVYPEGQSVDVLLSDDGTRLSNVQVMVPTGSSDTGLVDLPDPGLPVDDSRWNFNTNPERFLRAVVAFYRHSPVCIGFLLPQVTQVTFKRKNFRVDRHASDVYATTDEHGNTEFSHPSGVYLRIATDPAHEDLTGQDFDKKWAITKNTGAAVHVHLQALGGMSLDVDPTGHVVITAPSLIINGATTINGQTTINGATQVTGATIGLNGATTITGATEIDGTATINGSTINGAGNFHTTGTITGDTDVIAGGKSGKSHFHADPQGGNVGPPLP
jgi:hypothetical protein